MNGVHDMGGMHGMGPVVREEDEPAFHHEWERRAFAITLASGFLGRWNLDMSRHARELIPPVPYLAASYYERWLYGLERQLVEHGLATPREIETGVAEGPAAGVRVLEAGAVERALRSGRGGRVDEPVPPRFGRGDRVVARNINPRGHTRLPRYARGRQGVVDRDHGVFVFPDAHASGLGEKPQHVYSVRFAARELWGPEASSHDAIYIDLWDDYLDPA